MTTFHPAHPGRRAFTLVELMVSLVILTMLVLILVSITGQTSRTWRYTSGKMEQFREARTAFETMSTRIAQATLNTYWDYDNPTTPTRYERRSELRFLSGPATSGASILGDAAGRKRYSHALFFHAPLGFVDDTASSAQSYHGLENLLNIWGYFVEFADDTALRPPILDSVQPPIPSRYRFRLMEFMQPSEKMRTYNLTSGADGSGKPYAETYTGRDWYSADANSKDAPVHVLAENVVALVVWPKLSKQDREDIKKTSGGAEPELVPDFLYDTTKGKDNKLLNPKNQLPPVVQLTMVAIDETSASRLRLTASSSDPFSTQGKFLSATNFNKDLVLDPTTGADASLENKLVALKVSYRVFTTEIPVRAAKWSREQTDTPKP